MLLEVNWQFVVGILETNLFDQYTVKCYNLSLNWNATNLWQFSRVLMPIFKLIIVYDWWWLQFLWHDHLFDEIISFCENINSILSSPVVRILRLARWMIFLFLKLNTFSTRMNRKENVRKCKFVSLTFAYFIFFDVIIKIWTKLYVNRKMSAYAHVSLFFFLVNTRGKRQKLCKSLIMLQNVHISAEIYPTAICCYSEMFINQHGNETVWK